MDTAVIVLIVTFLLNGLLGVVMFQMRNSHDTARQEIKDLQLRQQHFQEHYLRREDFREFKQELWDRLDRFETTVKSQLSKP
jgi:hypothetical protein